MNLRFYFRSPRYSEDMDLDVLAGSVETPRRNGYRILEDRGLLRALQSYGISRIELNDPAKAKHTATTQRFRLRLVNAAGVALPTKVEFSRRGSDDAFVMETLDPGIALPYRRLAYSCQHYRADAAVRQKILALANRAEVQARDVFDLFILWRGGHIGPGTSSSVDPSDLARATDNVLALDYPAYAGQVLPYLASDALREFESLAAWNEMVDRTLDLLAGPGSIRPEPG